MTQQVAERERVCQWIQWMGFCGEGRSPPDDPEELRCAIIDQVQGLKGSALQCALCIIAALALPRERESKH